MLPQEHHTLERIAEALESIEVILDHIFDSIDGQTQAIKETKEQ
jgi:hypothetical protein